VGGQGRGDDEQHGAERDHHLNPQGGGRHQDAGQREGRELALVIGWVVDDIKTLANVRACLRLGWAGLAEGKVEGRWWEGLTLFGG